MEKIRALIIGAGIGGLAAAIAFRQKGFHVVLIEKDPAWSVYGVGLIQQANVIREITQLGLAEDYIEVGFGFDHFDVVKEDGKRTAWPSKRLVPDYPAIIGMGRPDLQKVLASHAKNAGAAVRLGVTARTVEQDASGVTVSFSDSTVERYDIVVGADGVHSAMRKMVFPDAPDPRYMEMFTWRYNMNRPRHITNGWIFNAPDVSVGFIPTSEDLMYIFLNTAEPERRRYAREGLAGVMRNKIGSRWPEVDALSPRIVEDENVVTRPLESFLLEGPWHKGRVVLLGDAVHAATPHMAQGAGLAIEDGVVLADELARQDDIERAFDAYRQRRFARSRFICESAAAVCEGSLGKRPDVDYDAIYRNMYVVMARPLWSGSPFHGIAEPLQFLILPRLRTENRYPLFLETL